MYAKSYSNSLNMCDIPLTALTLFIVRSTFSIHGCTIHGGKVTDIIFLTYKHSHVTS